MATQPEGSHPSFTLAAPSLEDVERVWRDYWAPLLAEGGLPRLKAELFDAHWLVDQARQVYRHVTGGLCDDLTASAEGILAMAEAQVERRVEVALAEQAARLRRQAGPG